MTPLKFVYSSMTQRLIVVTAIVIFFLVAMLGILSTYWNYRQVISERTEATKSVLASHRNEISSLLRRTRDMSSAQRAKALETLFWDLAGTKDVSRKPVCHFSIISYQPKIDTVFQVGEAVPPIKKSELALMKSSDEAVMEYIRGEAGMTVIFSVPIRNPGSNELAAIARLGTHIPSFTYFALKHVRQTSLHMSILFVFAILLSVVLISLVTRSLRSVASYAKAIEQGKFQHDIPVLTHDEAGTMAEAFNVVLHRLKQSYVSTLGALAALLETKDRSTETHSMRGVRYALEMGKAMKLSERELMDLEYGALLHDIGKIGIDDVVLKKPGPLSEEEWHIMRQHPTIGYNVLKNLEFLQGALPVILYHQERFDGKGYPNGLRGEQIPLLARIFTIADSFDAMTSDRIYRHALKPEQALQEIRRNAGSQFDPQLVETFIKLHETGALAKSESRPITPIPDLMKG